MKLLKMNVKTVLFWEINIYVSDSKPLTAGEDSEQTCNQELAWQSASFLPFIHSTNTKYFLSSNLLYCPRLQRWAKIVWVLPHGAYSLVGEGNINNNEYLTRMDV